MAIAKVPRTTHQWLKPLYDLLDQLITAVNLVIGGGSSLLEVDAVFAVALATNTYANGTAGVGATLTGTGFGALGAQDGITPVVGKVLLVTGESSQSHNGPYVVTVVGDGSHAYKLTRWSEFDTSAKMLDGTIFGVRSGTVNADTTWKYTGGDAPTVGSTNLTFARDPGVVTTNTTQSISGAKTFSAAPTMALVKGGNNNTSGHTMPNVADDTLALLAASQTLASKTLTSPTIAAVKGGNNNTTGHAVPNLADDTFALLAATQELTAKTLTAQVVKDGLTASGSASNDFSGSTGEHKTSTGLNTHSGDVLMAAGKIVGYGPLQLIATAGPVAANVTTKTTRYDLATAANNITSVLADGTRDGQHKTLMLATISAGKTVVISPTHFADGSTITIAAKFDLVELEWHAGGWIVVGMAGTPLIA